MRPEHVESPPRRWVLPVMLSMDKKEEASTPPVKLQAADTIFLYTSISDAPIQEPAITGSVDPNALNLRSRGLRYRPSVGELERARGRRDLHLAPTRPFDSKPGGRKRSS